MTQWRCVPNHMMSLECKMTSLIIPHLIGLLREELESGEAGDLNSIHLVLGGVHLGNDNVFIGGKVFRQFVPDWSQLFAMTTPWCIWRTRRRSCLTRVLIMMKIL